jgi:hypothetical protein
MYPTEIEADFALHLPAENLFDWHRGTRDEHGVLVLSSRRLLVLLAGLPETSSYKRSRRGGYLSEAELVQYETYNEVSRLRASYYAVKGGEEASYEPFQFIDPVLLAEQAMDDSIELDEVDEISDQIYDDMGM